MELLSNTILKRGAEQAGAHNKGAQDGEDYETAKTL
jgi:hypothetical protein